MAKAVAVIIGALFIIIGLLGFFFHNIAGTHLSWVHNLIHLASGAASLYIGLKGSMTAAKIFGYAFGAFYLALGVAGYWLGMVSTSELPHSVDLGGYNSHMFRIIPGYLELGSMDHLLHVVLGAAYILAAVMTRRSMTAYLENDPIAETEQVLDRHDEPVVR